MSELADRLAREAAALRAAGPVAEYTIGLLLEARAAIRQAEIAARMVERSCKEPRGQIAYDEYAINVDPVLDWLYCYGDD